MVDEAYMLEKPPGPSPVWRFLNQVVVPAAIDLTGTGEVAIQRLSERTGLRPAILVAGIMGGTVLLLGLAVTRRRTRPVATGLE